MKTAGIIVEYNPLHNGHVYHYEQAKQISRADAVVAVMSGHFLQRGEPAIVNKWARTEMALRMGADVVIELPVVYCAQPAEWFAFGAVSALHNTGIVDSLCFGSESGDIQWMLALARTLKQEPEALKLSLKKHLKSGMNYPAAFSAAVIEYAPEVDRSSVTLPNNTLGLHYLVALERLNSAITPYTIPRIKAGYNQHTIDDHQIASATALRTMIREASSMLPTELQHYMPAYSFELLKHEFQQGRGPLSWEDYARPLFHQLLSTPAEELSAYHEVNEGLEYRIQRVLSGLNVQYFPKVEQLLDQLKTKRYTRAKLQRMLLRILLQHRKSAWNRGVLSAGTPYLRVLGFSPVGRELLKRMKSTASVPIVTKVTQHTSPLLALDIRASSVYALAYKHASRDQLQRDYIQAPIQTDNSSS